MSADAAKVPILEVRGVTKTFPGVIANEDIDFVLNRGEIHCLLGENGAGKSTLVNVIFGLYHPDAGEIFLRGEELEFKGVRHAIAQGIGMVHQHFQLIPVFTVAENVILGNELTKGPLLDIREARRRIREIGEKYGLVVDPDAKVGDLSVGEQQRVELVKALFREAEILILDEPTAVLTPGEVDEFFGVVRTLVDQGKSIIFITHKLREVLAVADRITVLRGGKVAGSADPTTATQQSLANLMVGRDVVFRVEKGEAKPGDTVFSIKDLCVEDERGVQTVNDFTVEVRAGEIFGIAGVEGNGQRELVEADCGDAPQGGRQGRDPGQGHHQAQSPPGDRTRNRPHPGGSQQARSGRSLLHRRQSGDQPVSPRPLLAAGGAQSGGDPRRRSGPRRGSTTSAPRVWTSRSTRCRAAISRR